MTHKARHHAVQIFHTDPSIRVMIASLKCGGQALNLTCANRVISIDLWWNRSSLIVPASTLLWANSAGTDSIEQQAFGRVFRIGQHKETYVTRFVIKNTVDCRMLDMQADKVRTIDRAMHDVCGATVQPLSITELATLFGHLRE